jgi:hypothetical protein
MHTSTVFLHEAGDAVDAYALALPGDVAGSWRAQKGFGGKFHRVWTLDLQSDEPLPIQAVDWDAVLVRAIEAYNMRDPVITNFEWPLLGAASRGTVL